MESARLELPCRSITGGLCCRGSCCASLRPIEEIGRRACSLREGKVGGAVIYDAPPVNTGHSGEMRQLCRLAGGSVTSNPTRSALGLQAKSFKSARNGPVPRFPVQSEVSEAALSVSAKTTSSRIVALCLQEGKVSRERYNDVHIQVSASRSQCLRGKRQEEANESSREKAKLCERGFLCVGRAKWSASWFGGREMDKFEVEPHPRTDDRRPTSPKTPGPPFT